MTSSSWRSLTAALTLGATLTLGCAGTAALKRKTGPAYEAETQSWIEAVRRLGGPGMWLVVRGYHRGDDVVAVASNSPLSHAAIIGAATGEVIEAVGEGVRSTTLSKLLHESHRVQIVKPRGWTPALGATAVTRARTQLGKGYDFLGVIGAPDKKRWYCSELAAWSMGVPVDKRGAWHVIHPKDLHKQGTLLFDSGARDGKPDAALAR